MYLVPRDDGGIVIGATSREDDLDAPSTGGTFRLLRDASAVVPAEATAARTARNPRRKSRRCSVVNGSPRETGSCAPIATNRTSAAVSPTVVANTLMIQKNRVTSGTLLIIVPIWLRATVAVLVVVMVSRFSGGGLQRTEARVNGDGCVVQRSVNQRVGG